jgi:uncharacterized protein YndB with AHSA1/START domain
MKWILIVLGSLFGLLILGAGVLFAMGASADANRTTTSIVIHQKPEVVWPWLYKSDQVKQWVSWLTEIRDEGKEPAVGNKSTWVMQDRNNNDARMEIVVVVKSVEPARRLQVDLSVPGSFRGTSTYSLTARSDGSTRLDSDARYEFDNAFARFMTPIICWQARKKMVEDQSHLRSLLESGK